jgi:hypothetical protein
MNLIFFVLFCYQGVSTLEGEKARIRLVCASQLLKLAQETAFKGLITAEYFHAIAKLIIDPTPQVRDIFIKKLQKGVKMMKLPIPYIGIFALSGFDLNRERKTKAKKIYTQLIKQIRLAEAKQQQQRATATGTVQQRPKIQPEICLPYAISLLAHNIKIESAKDDHKMKQIKECMSIILDPLLDTNPDAHQVAFIKKMLNKIKESNDGLSSVLFHQLKKETAEQNLYQINKNLCLICEVFLFHMHSLSISYLTPKEYQFEIKLPSGYFVVKENTTQNDVSASVNKENGTSSVVAPAPAPETSAAIITKKRKSAKEGEDVDTSKDSTLNHSTSNASTTGDSTNSTPRTKRNRTKEIEDISNDDTTGSNEPSSNASSPNRRTTRQSTDNRKTKDKDEGSLTEKVQNNDINSENEENIEAEPNNTSTTTTKTKSTNKKGTTTTTKKAQPPARSTST